MTEKDKQEGRRDGFLRNAGSRRAYPGRSDADYDVGDQTESCLYKDGQFVPYSLEYFFHNIEKDYKGISRITWITDC